MTIESIQDAVAAVKTETANNAVVETAPAPEDAQGAAEVQDDGDEPEVHASEQEPAGEQGDDETDDDTDEAVDANADIVDGDESEQEDPESDKDGDGDEESDGKRKSRSREIRSLKKQVAAADRKREAAQSELIKAQQQGRAYVEELQKSHAMQEGMERELETLQRLVKENNLLSPEQQRIMEMERELEQLRRHQQQPEQEPQQQQQAPAPTITPAMEQTVLNAKSEILSAGEKYGLSKTAMVHIAREYARQSQFKSVSQVIDEVRKDFGVPDVRTPRKKRTTQRRHVTPASGPAAHAPKSILEAASQVKSERK